VLETLEVHQKGTQRDELLLEGQRKTPTTRYRALKTVACSCDLVQKGGSSLWFINQIQNVEKVSENNSRRAARRSSKQISNTMPSSTTGEAATTDREYQEWALYQPSSELRIQ